MNYQFVNGSAPFSSLCQLNYDFAFVKFIFLFIYIFILRYNIMSANIKTPPEQKFET